MMKGKTVWMSNTPMEMQSQGYHALLSKGDVLVMGLGMGALAFNLMHNPHVTSVTVIEKDPDVVDLMLKAGKPWIDNLNIITADALEYKPANEPDTLIVDIWPSLGDTRTESHMKRILRNVHPDRVAWWGQELTAVSWMGGQGFEAPVTSAQLMLYEAHIGCSLMGASHPEYPRLVMDAVITLDKIMADKLGTISHASAMNAIGGII
jgi:hypothetical protein